MFRQRRENKVMDMLYKYREAFSLRDEIGIYPNIEVEIDVTDKSPFFIRPHHLREEDIAFINKRDEVVMLYGYSERRILSLLKPSDANK